MKASILWPQRVCFFIKFFHLIFLTVDKKTIAILLIDVKDNSTDVATMINEYAGTNKCALYSCSTHASSLKYI